MTMYEPRRLVERVLEAAIMLCVAAYLIKLAVSYVISVRVALIIIAAAAVLVIGGIRLYRYFVTRDHWKEQDREDE